MPIDIDADIDMYSWQPNNGKYDTSRDSYTHTHTHMAAKQWQVRHIAGSVRGPG